jgi:segregation and condensation protein B
MEELEPLQVTAVATEPEESHPADERDAVPPPAEDESESRAGESLSDDELLQAVTVLVFASSEPLSEKRLASLLEGAQPERIRAALDALSERLRASGLPLELVSIAGGFQILTAQRMSETVQRLFKAKRAERVSPAALETLSVVAYRQPVTKAEIEAIRGVQVAPILRTLIDRGFVRVVGRADVPGHPLQYGTTREFLNRFGLGEIDDLPRDSELTKD